MDDSLVNGGTKHDSGKPQWHVLPWKGLEDVVRVFEYGANKYGEGNYRKGFEADRLWDACMRHLIAWKAEGADPESGQSHLAHAATNLLIMLELIKEGKLHG